MTEEGRHLAPSAGAAEAAANDVSHRCGDDHWDPEFCLGCRRMDVTRAAAGLGEPPAGNDGGAATPLCGYGRCMEEITVPDATMCQEHTTLIGRCLACGEDRGARAAARAVAGGPCWPAAWCEKCRRCSDCSGRPHCMRPAVYRAAYPAEAHGACTDCSGAAMCGACLGCRACCACVSSGRVVISIPRCRECNLRPGASYVMTRVEEAPEASEHLFHYHYTWLCAECEYRR
jgi:hypothetical protein